MLAEVFYDSLTWKLQKKILWTLEIVETLDRIPEIYFKHLENSEGLYEIRGQVVTFTASSAFLTKMTWWLSDTARRRKHKRHQKPNLTEQR